jgi:hypothetical protein
VVKAKIKVLISVFILLIYEMAFFDIVGTIDNTRDRIGKG